MWAIAILIGLAAGFGSQLALARARAPFAAWSEATGYRATRFLPLLWLRLGRARPVTPELEKARRRARFWIAAANTLLMLGLALITVFAVLAYS